jgi:hypothetical protein
MISIYVPDNSILTQKQIWVIFIILKVTDHSVFLLCQLNAGEKKSW